MMGGYKSLPAGLLLLLLVLIAIAASSEGQRLIEWDDFNSWDGAPPSGAKWEREFTDGSNTILIKDNTLKFHSEGRWPTIKSKFPIQTNTMTFTYEWVPRTFDDRPLGMTIKTDVDGSWANRLKFGYTSDDGWYYATFQGGSEQMHRSNKMNAYLDVWYVINITCMDTDVTINVTRKATGAGVYSASNEVTAPFRGDNKVYIFVVDATACIDNFHFYDASLPPNKAPVWSKVPRFQAVEDIPLTYDFSGNVSDPDNWPMGLYITSPSPYVTDIMAFNVTFEFPNGITAIDVPLVLNDGRLSTVQLINFTIEPVNDPPEHDVRTEHMAVEDVPLTINFTLHIWDVDNETSELFLTVDDPYTTVEGQTLTFLFPEEVQQHVVWVNLSDGIDMVEIRLSFFVKPVDDPPTIDPLGEFNATEDQLSIFNVSSFLHDVDTPLHQLGVTTKAENCTVHGHELHFLYPIGGIDVVVNVEVSDATTRGIFAELKVHVNEVNDAPIVHSISPKLFKEDKEETFNLTVYIEDEDNTLEELTLECEHPNVTGISHLSLSLLYTTWQEEHNVTFRVFDGMLWSEGFFTVQVQSINDPPTIKRLGNMTQQGTIVIDEGTELWLEVNVTDEESRIFKYSVSSAWEGVVVFQNGSVRIAPAKGELGLRTFSLHVDDGNGGTDSWDLSVVIEGVNDPPSVPTILRPKNHTRIEEGNNITFGVEVYDPDMDQGDVLTVTWESNISGLLKTLTTRSALQFMTDQLAVGTHRITVKVTDGEYESEAWLEVEVIKGQKPNGNGNENGNGNGEVPLVERPIGIAAIAIIVLLVALVVINLMISARRRREAEAKVVVEPPEPPVEEPTEEGEEVKAPSKEDLRELHAELGKLASELEASKGEEAAPPEEPEQLDIETVTPPTEEDLADRAHAGVVREVMKLLTQLPRGMPTTLWGKDIATLAREIVDGPKKTAPDGATLVEVEGRWYYADHTKLGTFLMEFKEEKAAAAPEISEDERATKLDKLESALLDGKISEETYKELKKKYEGE